MGGGEGAQGGCDQRAHDGLEGRDPHRAGRLAGQLGQVAFGLPQLRGDKVLEHADPQMRTASPGGVGLVRVGPASPSRYQERLF
jgi:hypothetical protein